MADPLVEYELAIWSDADAAFGPGCETVERMNRIRATILLLVRHVEELHHRVRALEERLNG
jgi:hypothetical protein